MFNTKTSVRRLPLGRLLVCGILFCGFMFCGGCKDDKESTHEPGGLSTEETEGEWGEHLLEYAVKNLQRLDEFQTGEMRQQVIDRLNQWIRAKSVPVDWKVDPMVASLPKRLRDLPAVKDLGKQEFSRHDGLVLQEDVWFRDVSNWSRGDRLDDIQRAKRLFDWTVRNIQLEQSGFAGKVKAPQWPWETMLMGRGTAEDRAWVFALLARQQGIDAVLLALPCEDGSLGVWTVGVLDGEKQLYLFDPKLGLPIPGPEGVKFKPERSGVGFELDINPATLAEVAKDDKLLRQLDLEKQKPYPLASSRLQKVVALIVTSPAALSARMAMFENKLSGDERVVLTADPSDVAERLKDVEGLSDVRLWQRPFETMLERGGLGQQQRNRIESVLAPFNAGGVRPLWRGRTLYLKGRFSGKENATTYLQEARPPNRKLAELRSELIESARLSIDDIEAKIAAYRRGKQDATYWLGLLAVIGGDQRAAIDYFNNKTLETWPHGPWTSGSKYNLARTYESAGELKKAVRWLQADADSPAREGNLLRAQWLEGELATQEAAAERERKASEAVLPVLPE